MFARFIEWWIRNATYIGPIANCLSALAALGSVVMVYITLRQSRSNRQEALDAKHPRFKVLKGNVEWVTFLENDYSIQPFHELKIDIQNVRETSAKRLRIKGSVYGKRDENAFALFEREPADDVEQDSLFLIRFKLPKLSPFDKPYIVVLELSYRDSRTGKKHPQTLYRQFYFQDKSGSFLSLDPVDKTELKELFSGNLARIIHKYGDNKIE